MTAVLLLPVMPAVNCCVPPGCTVAAVGETETETGGGGGVWTATCATAYFVVSAAEVAVTVKCQAVDPAVYSPDDEMVPPVAAQATAVSLLPVTVALNC